MQFALLVFVVAVGVGGAAQETGFWKGGTSPREDDLGFSRAVDLYINTEPLLRPIPFNYHLL